MALFKSLFKYINFIKTFLVNWRNLDRGWIIGLERGSITSAINIYRTELGLGDEEIKGRIMDKFGLDSTEAERYIAMAE